MNHKYVNPLEEENILENQLDMIENKKVLDMYANNKFGNCRFVGFIRDPAINDGNPIPWLEPLPPTDGRLSINTTEGWIALCEEQKRRNAQRETEKRAAEKEMLRNE